VGRLFGLYACIQPRQAWLGLGRAGSLRASAGLAPTASLAGFHTAAIPAAGGPIQ